MQNISLNYLISWNTKRMLLIKPVIDTFFFIFMFVPKFDRIRIVDFLV